MLDKGNLSMSNQLINPQPNYSGVTIQIANPAVNLSPYGVPAITPANQILNPQNVNACPQAYCSEYQNDSPQSKIKSEVNQGYPYAYPPQYYLNNYNTTNVNEKGSSTTGTGLSNAENQGGKSDTTLSENIIGDINDRIAEQNERKKNTKEKRIIALTDEYIRSLENYLDNPNDEVRIMASKEVLKRLDEDKSRYDDAALNALLNKMMQDPSKLVRIAALSAFSSQLASGNDYTVKLLKDIQSNPKSDKEDVMQAADALLKMSADVEIKEVPITSAKKDNNESKAE